MEDFIIYRKIVTLERNKEFLFRIPTSFNPLHSEFLLEVAEQDFPDALVIEIHLTDHFSGGNGIWVPITLSNPATHFCMQGLPAVQDKDYLLLGCRSANPLQFAISLAGKKKTETIPKFDNSKRF